MANYLMISFLLFVICQDGGKRVCIVVVSVFVDTVSCRAAVVVESRVFD
jgi:hypothetical protein